MVELLDTYRASQCSAVPAESQLALLEFAEACAPALEDVGQALSDDDWLVWLCRLPPDRLP